MKAKIKYILPVLEDEVDLEDYGHDEDVSWDDLDEDQQNEITDSLREQIVIECSIESLQV